MKNSPKDKVILLVLTILLCLTRTPSVMPSSYSSSSFIRHVKLLPRLIDKDKAMKCKHCQFKTRCWDQDGESIEAMKLPIEHRPNRLFDDLNNSMINNHID